MTQRRRCDLSTQFPDRLNYVYYPVDKITMNVCSAPATLTRGEERLKVGMNLGGFVVQGIAEGRLTLRGSRKFAVKAIVVGTFLLIFGLLAWAAVARGDAHRQHIAARALVAPLIGAISLLIGLVRLGETWEFDAASRTLVLFRFLGHRILRPGSLTCVRLTALPTNLRQRETLVLDLVVSDRIWFPVGRIRTSKPAAADLITAAAQISDMLQLPLDITGELASAMPCTIARFSQLANTPRPLNRAA